MFVADNEPAFANDLSGVVPKSAVNKLLNLINKSEKTSKLEVKNTTNSQLTSALKQSKVAILLAKTKETN